MTSPPAPLVLDAWLRRLPRYLYVEDLVIGARVLEIGASAGLGADLLAERGAARVVGVDLSGEAVARARAAFHRPNLEFELVVDYAAQAFRDGSFDLVVAPEAQALLDLDGFLEEVQRLLAPRGHALFAVPVGGGTESEAESEAQAFASKLAPRFGAPEVVRQRLLVGWALAGRLPDEGEAVAAARFDGSLAGAAKAAGATRVSSLLAICGPVARRQRGVQVVELPPDVLAALAEETRGPAPAGSVRAVAAERARFESERETLGERLMQAELELGRTAAVFAVELKGLRARIDELTAGAERDRAEIDEARRDALSFAEERDAAFRDRDEALAGRDQALAAYDLLQHEVEAAHVALEAVRPERERLEARLGEMEAELARRTAEDAATVEVPAVEPPGVVEAADAMAAYAAAIARERAEDLALIAAERQALEWEREAASARAAFQAARVRADIERAERTTAEARLRVEEVEATYRARESGLDELRDAAARAAAEVEAERRMLADAEALLAEARAGEAAAVKTREEQAAAMSAALVRADAAEREARDARLAQALAEGNLLRQRAAQHAAPPDVRARREDGTLAAHLLAHVEDGERALHEAEERLVALERALRSRAEESSRPPNGGGAGGAAGDVAGGAAGGAAGRAGGEDA